MEAVLALAIGAGGGAGFLFQTGDLKTPAQVDMLQKDLDDTRRSIGERKESVRKAEEALREAEERAKEEAEKARRAAEEAAKVAEAEKAKKEAEAAASRLPAFGMLSIKAAADLSAEHGGERQRGKAIEFAFEEKPGKIKLKSGPFTIYLTPRVSGSKLVVDASVTPMAILSDGDQRNVGNLKGLSVARTPVKLDVQSPAAGNLNLMLQFRK